MSLFSIAFKNIKRNFYNYFLYFLSMSFSIMIYFTFTSIRYNSEIQKAIGDSKMISGSFKASSIVIAIFAAMFIWFSNSFFTKKRKNEIALYSMMGVKKKQIGRMLFYETLLMGVIALLVGILFGGLLSKMFTTILIKLMNINSITVKFTLIPKAVIQTSLVFLALFLIASLHGYSIIYRFKLVDLFKAEQSGESMPKSSLILAILSLILIGLGYILASPKWMMTLFPVSIFAVLGLTIGGTYILFSSFVVFIIKLSRKNTRRYYKGINMIGTSNLLYRIKGNAKTLATIAVLSATTLTAVGTTYSIYFNTEREVSNRFPIPYVFVTEDKKAAEKIEKTIEKYPKNKLLSSHNIELMDVKAKYPSLMKNAKGKYVEDTFSIISQSKYNELNTELNKKEPISLKDTESIIFDPNFSPKFQNDPTGNTYTIVCANKSTDFKINEIKNTAVINQNILGFKSLMVINDEQFNKLYDKKSSTTVLAYITSNKKDSSELSNELSKILPQKSIEDKEKSKDFSDKYSEFYEPHKGMLEVSGLSIFIGAFLGLVFLICTGSIIFFKQLSEASSDKSNYDILKKVGVSKKEVKASIAKQMLLVFILPLIVGISHASFALKLLSDILNSNLLVPILLCYLTYTIIYLIYYVLTVNSYYSIVSSNS